MVLLFFCNFGIIGPVGNGIRDILFGIFGWEAYITPILVFLAAAFWFANEGSSTALRKLIAGIVLFLMLGVICDMIAGTVSHMENYDIKAIYESCSSGRKGGGILAGSLSYLLRHSLETVGTVLVVALCSVISLILVTERSLLSGMKGGLGRLREAAAGSEDEFDTGEQDEETARDKRDAARQRKEDRQRLREERMRDSEARKEERRLRAEEKENEKILRMEKKVSGVTAATSLRQQEDRARGDMHEITYRETEETAADERTARTADAGRPNHFDFDKIHVRTAHQVNLTETAPEEFEASEVMSEEIRTESISQGVRPGRSNYGEEMPLTRSAEQIRIHKEGVAEQETSERRRPEAAPPKDEGMSPAERQIHKEMQSAEKKAPKKYMFPPLSRLQKGVAATGDSTRELKETAMRLQQTLETFGVRVTVTDISQGPSVTRYELQPEQGVKVSKIVGLSDDIKLNLAATDIRIEAPIPGKAAVGIEVPNKENMTVALRDLFESQEFKNFPSNIAFAVGKDIAGKTVVTDIAKMPHMLIAGATGSGKSVCINTLIMSILYKAHPDDVKLIMVDPKVVELSVYNGIPHLLIPVVTDPKKASAALHWAVSEMEDRYRKFADYNVRDLKGYNKKLEEMRERGEEDVPSKLPQIVIIVDELADLMMVSPGEVEESICRLAQLARACGIHLIIATQRPSVDVITG
ncbi:MAG: DNA translocase FtsK, partial [Bacteroides sp.]|nr:DNA translocase FtsK [Bacteroides sp.]